MPPKEGFYVTAVNELSDYLQVKFYKIHRPMPTSGGDRSGNLRRPCLSASENGGQILILKTGRLLLGVKKILCFGLVFEPP
ncbi:MAG: hypothetical protein ACI87E_003171, partial [Mariniblastus sp.]